MSTSTVPRLWKGRYWIVLKIVDLLIVVLLFVANGQDAEMTLVLKHAGLYLSNKPKRNLRRRKGND